MNLLLDPPASQWTLSNFHDTSARVWLAASVNRSAGRYGSQTFSPDQPVIATGHQGWFWHPGILAKDLVAISAANKHRAMPLHLVVDHDAHLANTLEIPFRQDNLLRILTVTLGPQDPDTPLCCLAPWNPAEVFKSLASAIDPIRKQLVCNPDELLHHWHTLTLHDAPEHINLADQVTWLLVQFSSRRNLGFFMSSELAESDSFRTIVQDMLRSPGRCIDAYNAATSLHASAGIAPMRVTHNKIELPLWAVSKSLGPGPRLRLFTRAGASVNSQGLILENDEPINPSTHRVLPRALLMSAIMRRHYCDLFIHGKGGGEYDRITDAWWSAWRHEPLAPRAVVSADLRLIFGDLPIATPADLTRKIWFRHHLPHNLDHEPAVAATPIAVPLVREKQACLAAIAATQDRKARSTAFHRIHTINAELGALGGTALADADAAIQTSRAGVANRAAATRRDWFFGFYPKSGPDTVNHLTSMINAQFPG